MDWWKELFADEDYLSIYSPYITIDTTIKQINFLVNQIKLNPTQNILDLCCGTGRHSLELARRGFKVTGLDWSKKFIKRARSSAESEGLSVNFIQGDMRRIIETDYYDVIINMFTSFGYFEKDDENESVIKGIAEALKLNGIFVFDFVNIAQLLRYPIPVISYKDLLTERLVTRERKIDFFRWRMIETCRIGNDKDYEEYCVSYRLYTLAEFINMLSRNGLQFDSVFGDFDGSDYCENYPPRMIVVSRKQN